MGEARSPTCSEMPVFALDVMDHGRRGPAQQCRHHQAHALAGARWREGQNVFRPFVAQVLAVMQTKKHTEGSR